MIDRYHLSVMPDEVNKFLICDQDGIYLDATLGGGGHTENILKNTSKKNKVFAIDLDNDAIKYASRKFNENAEYEERYFLFNENFTNINLIAENNGYSKNVSGILFDLGVSSYQLDNPEKGFTYRENVVLDLRMDKMQGKPAYVLLNELDERNLYQIFSEYGEDKKSRSVTKAIIEARKDKKFLMTQDFVSLIQRFAGPQILNKVLSRYFQALRIAVNNELENLKEGLEKSIDVLKIGGRLVVISYHSLEDRIVKNIFREKAKTCICPPNFPKCICETVPKLKVLTTKPISPSQKEIGLNTRSRSAKLRAAERI